MANPFSSALMDSDDDLFAIYDALYAPLVEKYGPLDDTILSSPMMIFGMSFSIREADGLYVMYEPFHLDQTRSREGLKFAVFMVSDAPREDVTDFLTELADWVLENPVGDGDMIELSEVGDAAGTLAPRAELRLFSRGPEGFGLYEARLLAG